LRAAARGAARERRGDDRDGDETIVLYNGVEEHREVLVVAPRRRRDENGGPIGGVGELRQAELGGKLAQHGVAIGGENGRKRGGGASCSTRASMPQRALRSRDMAWVTQRLACASRPTAPS
jgi:hypothetical protein